MGISNKRSVDPNSVKNTQNSSISQHRLRQFIDSDTGPTTFSKVIRSSINAVFGSDWGHT